MCPNSFWHNTYHLMPLSNLQLNGLFEKPEDKTVEEKGISVSWAWALCKTEWVNEFKVSLVLVILLFPWRQQLPFCPDIQYLSTNEKLTWSGLENSNKAQKSVTKCPKCTNTLTKSDYKFWSRVTPKSFPLLNTRSHCNTEGAGEVAVVQRR